MMRGIFLLSAGMLLYGLVDVYRGIQKNGGEKKDSRRPIFVFLSYFTVLSNIFLGVYWMMRAFGKEMPVAEAGVRLYITITGIVYWTILRPKWAKEKIRRPSNQILHVVTPILAWVFYLIQGSHGGLFIFDIVHLIWFPVLYLMGVMLYGHHTGKYPYFFLDIQRMGFSKWALTVGLFLLGILLLCLFIYFIDYQDWLQFV